MTGPLSGAPPGKQQRPRLATESAAESIDHDDDDTSIVTLTAYELARHAELFFNFGVTYAAMQTYEADHEIRELAREVWKTPRYAELEGRRQHSDEPCGIRTCRGCSRCVRADAVRRGVVRS